MLGPQRTHTHTSMFKENSKEIDSGEGAPAYFCSPSSLFLSLFFSLSLSLSHSLALSYVCVFSPLCSSFVCVVFSLRCCSLSPLNVNCSIFLVCVYLSPMLCYRCINYVQFCD